MDMTKKFLDDVFFPTVDLMSIQRVVHLGDILDRRKYVAFTTAKRVRDDFLVPLRRRDVEVDLTGGNHDVVFRNTNSVNGPEELFRDLMNIHMDPYEREFSDGTKFLYLPWINSENHEASMKLIGETKAQICFGHLEIEGFEMYRGQPTHEGLSPDLFKKFDVTCSGHFHHKSSRRGIHYLGSHGEFTWADYDDERGFHVFDTQTRELEFFPNPYTMFEKVHYSDDTPMDSLKFRELEGKYVKLVVHSRDDAVRFEQFISNLERGTPADIQVVDDHLNSGDVLESMDEVDETEDTLTIFRKALASSDYDQSDLDELVTSLYQEALEYES